MENNKYIKKGGKSFKTARVRSEALNDKNDFRKLSFLFLSLN